MKLFVLGPSCVGKTRLSGILSQKMKIKRIDLDLCFNDLDGFKKTGKFGYVDPKEGKRRLMNQIKKESEWIVDGVFPVKELFEMSDTIVYMKYSFPVSFYYQWKRFATDDFQRKTYGFWTNLFFLTPDIFRQYFSKKDCDINDPRQFSVKKYEIILPKYANKLYRINDRKSLNNFIEKFVLK